MMVLIALFAVLGLECSVIPRSAFDLMRERGRYQIHFHSNYTEDVGEKNPLSSRQPYYVYVNRTRMCCYVPKLHPSGPFLELPNATEVEAMNQALSEYLGHQCLRTRNSWWFFELCWGSYLGQYHYKDETSAVKETEIYLFQSKESEEPPTFYDDKKSEPYLSYHYGNGTWCPEMNKNRTTEVRVYCNRPGGGRTIPHLQYDITQPRFCHHEVSFYTEALCQFKWFQPKTSTKCIDCYPADDSSEVLDDLNAADV